MQVVFGPGLPKDSGLGETLRFLFLEGFFGLEGFRRFSRRFLELDKDVGTPRRLEEWWEDLWLNEGFANWMETFTSDHLFPEWGVWEAYVGDDQQRALRLDALRSSHPIQVLGNLFASSWWLELNPCFFTMGRPTPGGAPTPT